MQRLLSFACTAALLGAADDTIVFRSDVTLARVDAQVIAGGNRAVTGLEVEDFVLSDRGQAIEIRKLVREEMPADVLLLLDVSGSMRPHIETIASAAEQAAAVLGEADRVGIMVFDRDTRIRMPLKGTGAGLSRELDRLLRQETFNGGTDITKALYDAAGYMRREGRRDARRAIVILTDDQTERDRDEAGVGRALAVSDTVVSALLAPDALGTGSMGGGWPSGGGLGGPLGGIILGRRGPYGSGVPTVGRARTRSAGTAAIARHSGGDSMNVNDAAAFETTLERLRQRYSLFYNLPQGGGDVEVTLSANARRRLANPEVRYRQVYQNGGSSDAQDAVISRRGDAPASRDQSSESAPPRLARRPAVSEPGERSARTIENAQPAAPPNSEGGWRRTGEPERPRAEEAAPQTPAQASETQRSGGWRRVKPGEQP